MERAVLVALPFLGGGLAMSLVLLLVPRSWDQVGVFTAQLTAIVLLGYAASLRLAGFAGAEWFAGLFWSPARRLVASGVGVVLLVTGVVGLVTLASSAALRFSPSLQFLQLISALDIAWVVGATVVGAQRAWNRSAAAIGGALIGGLCIWSIWNYLNTVGLGPDGSWIVDGGRLMRLVIPYDTAAAIVAVGVFLFGTRAANQAIEQASSQS